MKKYFKRFKKILLILSFISFLLIQNLETAYAFPSNIANAMAPAYVKCEDGKKHAYREGRFYLRINGP